MKIKFFLVSIGTFYFINVQASKVDTLQVYSASMKKNIKSVALIPDSYNKNKSYPVVYLLHGYSGNYADWAKSQVVQAAPDVYNEIIICPDGGYGSWYWDSPVDSAFKYETFVSKELVDWVDKNYSTIKSEKGRAIAGLSMGGYGALYIAIKHPGTFGATGSMSGGVDIRPFPNNWDIAKRLGAYNEYPERWGKNTLINMLHLVKPNALSIIIDCGTDDFFFQVNEELHRKLLYLNIPHDYISRPGKHNWEYWANAVTYQLLFFNRYFNSNK